LLLPISILTRQIVNVRLPEENGRFKGFGYVEFADKLSLIEALKLNEETFHKRTIRIDIADNQNKGQFIKWSPSNVMSCPCVLS